MRPERLRDLDGERADAAAGSVDEHALARLHLRVIAQALQRGPSGDADRGRLLERKALRLHEETVLARPNVFGERRTRSAEDIVPRFEPCVARPDVSLRAGTI